MTVVQRAVVVVAVYVGALGAGCQCGETGSGGTTTAAATTGAATGATTGTTTSGTTSAAAGTTGASTSGAPSSGTTSSGGSTGGTGTTGGAPGVPQLVQHESSSSTRNNGLPTSPHCYFLQLPQPTTVGNAVVVSYTYAYNSTATSTVTDDVGDTYGVLVSAFDPQHVQYLTIAAAFGVKAGAQVISVCFSVDPGGFVQPMATELANVVGQDGVGTGDTGHGAITNAGALTPSQNGDLLYEVAVSLSFAQAGFGAAPGLALLSADLMDGFAAQFGVLDSVNPTDPGISLTATDDWMSAVVLLRPGTAGGVPSGLRIDHLMHENVPDHAPAGGPGAPFANPLSLQFPSTGNLLVAMIGGGNGPELVTGVTDSKANSWKQAGQGFTGSDATVQAFYAAGAASSNALNLSVAWGGTDGDYTLLLYDVAGAADVPFDQVVGAIGTQATPEASGDTLSMAYSFTPGFLGEIVFSEVRWDHNTGSALEGQFFDANTFSGESQSGPGPVDENNGWGHVVTTTAAPLDVVWDLLHPGVATGAYAGLSVGFAAAGAAPAP